MSQQQSFGGGGTPGYSAIETVTGNTGGAVPGQGSPVNINLIGDTAQGVHVNGTIATSTQVITVDDATTVQKGVVTLPTQEIALNYVNVTTAMSPYTVTATDYFISCDSTAGAITIRLPNTTTNYREFVIKDRVGNASISGITVTTVGGVVTLDGATSYIFTDNYESLEILFNGTTYEAF